MSQANDMQQATRRAPGEETSESAALPSEWDADTHVMPLEYSRQLIAISRQLQSGE